MNNYIIIAFLFLTIILWIWAFFDISKSRFKKHNQKPTWLLGIIVFPIVGPILYFQFRKRFIKKPRKFQPKFNSSN